MTFAATKVLERLAYENLLPADGVSPRRWRVTLTDLMEAAKGEPRIYQVLPAILLHKPTVIYRLKNDLKKWPTLEEKARRIFSSGSGKEKDFFGVSAEACRQAALAFQATLQKSRATRRTRLFNLRLAEDDWADLQRVTEAMGTKNHSETIRRLVRENLLITRVS